MGLHHFANFFAVLLGKKNPRFDLKINHNFFFAAQNSLNGRKSLLLRSQKIREIEFCLLLFVRSPTPPKPAGLDSPIFCGHTLNWLWKAVGTKKLKNKITEIF
jgi:hypothetical protein